MAYTVLARKYRSRTFEEVIGQEPVATTLVNAIKAGRIHHGYLFTGTRGVGKTSMARILAKALNCLSFDAPTTTPCCECEACKAIAEGQDIDVIEIDAASNTGVDNIRELRSNTAYRPARSRYKIYIIDEVHMLSTGAFNALLKTLEEPPEHVKFILATTEIQKVPATIQSRCQRFVFRNIGPEQIADRLQQIIAAEGAQAEEAVVRRIARLANGSMRDALSILDQLLSVSPENLTAEVLDEILPPLHSEQVLTLLEHAAAGDVAAVLADADEILSTGRGLEVFCQEMIETARALLHVRACGIDSPIVDIPAAAREQYAELAGRFELSHYVQMIAMLEELRRNVRFSGAGRALTDALLVRLAHMRQWSPIERLLEQLPAGGLEKKNSSLADRPTTERGQTASAPSPLSGRTTGGSQPADATGPATDRGQTAFARPSPSPSLEGRGAEPSPLSRGNTGGSIEPASPHAPGPGGQPPPAGLDGDTVGDPAIGNNGDAPTPVTVDAQRLPVSPEQRRKILDDPLVKQTLELFEGTIVNMEQLVVSGPQSLEDADDDTE